jgi:hypothetical protein
VNVIKAASYGAAFLFFTVRKANMNQKPLRLGIGLCMAMLWICAIPMGSQAATNEQIILRLEEPESGNVYSGVGNIRGWAVAPQGIQRIELEIDGIYQTNIPSGGLRTDVGDAYPTYPNADESGFSMAFNYSNLALGPHTITVRAVDGQGDDRVVTATFNVTRFDNAFISNPSGVSISGATVRDEGESILIDNLLVEGKRYDVRLNWRLAMQGFAITQIASVGIPSDECSTTLTLGAVTIDDNVVVRNGTCITLDGTTVKGNVLVYFGGGLTTIGARVDGNIQAQDAVSVTVENTYVDGDIQLENLRGSSPISITSSTVKGNIQLERNSPPLRVVSNVVDGDVQAFSNRANPLFISSNRIDGNLQCKSNNPAPTGGGNIVSGNKEDQCSGL